MNELLLFAISYAMVVGFFYFMIVTSPIPPSDEIDDES